MNSPCRGTGNGWFTMLGLEIVAHSSQGRGLLREGEHLSTGINSWAVKRHTSRLQWGNRGGYSLGPLLNQRPGPVHLRQMLLPRPLHDVGLGSIVYPWMVTVSQFFRSALGRMLMVVFRSSPDLIGLKKRSIIIYYSREHENKENTRNAQYLCFMSHKE